MIVHELLDNDFRVVEISDALAGWLEPARFILNNANILPATVEKMTDTFKYVLQESNRDNYLSSRFPALNGVRGTKAATALVAEALEKGLYERGWVFGTSYRPCHKITRLGRAARYACRRGWNPADLIHGEKPRLRPSDRSHKSVVLTSEPRINY